MELGLAEFQSVPVSISILEINNRNLRVSLYYVVGAECLVLPEIHNGFIIDQTRKYFYGDEARVQCHRGFKLTGGPSIIKCGTNQTFSNVPKCEGKFFIFNTRFVCYYLTI